MDQVLSNREVIDFNSSGLSSESGLGSTFPISSELPPSGSPFPFTQEQETDLEAVYRANPFLEFTGRDILADALSVTEEDVHVWFIHRRFNDSYLQPSYTSSPRPPSPTSEGVPLGFHTPITASSAPPGALRYLMCSSSATVTKTYTSASIRRHRSTRLSSSRSYEQRGTGYGGDRPTMATDTTTCHRAPVICSQYSSSMVVRSRDSCRRRPIASACLRGRAMSAARRRPVLLHVDETATPKSGMVTKL